MADLSIGIFTGRLGSDPETREVGESTVHEFTIAVNRIYSRNGERVEQTTWIPVVVWDRNGTSRIVSHLSKGKRISVQGRWEESRWEKDGQKHSRLRLVTDPYSINLLDSAPQNSDDGEVVVPQAQAAPVPWA